MTAVLSNNPLGALPPPLRVVGLQLASAPSFLFLQHALPPFLKFCPTSCPRSFSGCPVASGLQLLHEVTPLCRFSTWDLQTRLYHDALSHPFPLRNSSTAGPVSAPSSWTTPRGLHLPPLPRPPQGRDSAKAQTGIAGAQPSPPPALRARPPPSSRPPGAPRFLSESPQERPHSPAPSGLHSASPPSLPPAQRDRGFRRLLFSAVPEQPSSPRSALLRKEPELTRASKAGRTPRPGSGGWKSKVKAQVKAVSGESLLPDSETAILSLHPHVDEGLRTEGKISRRVSSFMLNGRKFDLNPHGSALSFENVQALCARSDPRQMAAPPGCHLTLQGSFHGFTYHT
ncbi:WAS/WASL-interacting protein family member 1-like [Lutra lutra]|uniref:WAS/WASL-interacting protein family member 1-like n=1 Tax=Lutra lutra TaxID=9657 RepID=UPI001FD16CBD|nr:WAS/WASL-interacting protein family member 1-like [Lutra lutra]